MLRLQWPCYMCTSPKSSRGYGWSVSSGNQREKEVFRWHALGRSKYHPAFRGSFSLKRVLPALVPEMSYEGMAVGNGAEASLTWEKMLSSDDVKRNILRTSLVAYCGQDTFAMVRLLNTLRIHANVQGQGRCCP
jgi:hypothetical protein